MSQGIHTISQKENAITVQSVGTNVLEHIRSQRCVATARGMVGSATLMEKEKGNLNLQQKNVTLVG